jgi:peptidoglycan/xylan/chitin deacetylase (PgdA/CDA1 family)
MSLEKTLENHDEQSGSPQQCAWPTPDTVYLTLDLECDFGTALTENTYEAVEHVDSVVSLLEAADVPVTCFVQTELLDERPEVVERFVHSEATVTFHPHSHTHNERGSTSIEWEIERSTDRYREFFDRRPEGYRFPNGNVRESDYEVLAAHGYRFDASVFPTWRPGHFDNTSEPTVPTYLEQFDLFELPFTVASSLVPIPTGLSYCRLLGKPFTYYLTLAAPSTVVFNFHMHDLVTPATIDELPPLYRLIYARNDRGLSLFRELITAFREAGYQFDTLDKAHKQLRSGC